MAASTEGDGRTQPNGIDPAREVLLEEARTTLGEQLGQIGKIDDAAVRTVRISLLLLGVLAGGATLLPFPDLGTPGTFGTVGLIFTLVGAITTYGTSRVFIGSGPDELAVDYTTKPVVENTYVAILTEYDDGISDNRSTLRTNGFILAVSRALLVLSIVSILFGLVSHGSTNPPAATGTATSSTLAFILLPLQSSNEMSERERADDESVSRPIYVYTGPKAIADAKVAFGEWLEEHGF